MHEITADDGAQQRRTRRSAERGGRARRSGCSTFPPGKDSRLLLPKLEMPFARLMIMWFVAFIVISAVLTMLPLALIRVFGVSTGLPATTYAFAAAGAIS